MKDMLSLKNLKIKGFRGYIQDKEFSFDTPVVLLFGENHHGKSSTLNAIEWCLFGNECTGKNTGIRERIDWEIRNRNLPSKDEVFVELELETENKMTYKILRKLISKTKDELEINLPDGQLLNDQNAREKLTHLLKSSFRDFLTTVYQHQEAIRAILTQEPKERNDAIDRLLGLSDYRNILSGIKSADLEGKQKKMEESFSGFKNEIDVALNTRKRDLIEKRKEAIQKGVKEDHISEKGALEIAKTVKDELIKFTSTVGLSLTDLQLPEQWKGLQEFQQATNGEITRFRSEMPDVKKQSEFFCHKTQITSLISDYNQKNERVKIAYKELEEFIKKNGNEEVLSKTKSDVERQIALKNKEMQEVDAKGITISNAIDYLKVEGIDKNICPVCGKETSDLLRHLEEEWDKKYKEQIGKIKEEIEGLNGSLNNSGTLLSQLGNHKKSIETVKTEIVELNKKIGQKLKKEITEKDDPLVLLNNQSKHIEEELKKLEQSVSSRQETLNIIQARMNQIQLIVEILNLEEKRQIVENIVQTHEYQQMEVLKDQMAILVSGVNKIKQSVNEASYEEAKDKISSAEKMVDDYFRKITNNPAVSKIELLVSADKTGKNNYEFKDQNGHDLTPILSQGNLNALALSIFLGMACLRGTDQKFGFIMLDDPSQSLGSEHKEKLIEVLDDVLKDRMIILSTMDKELKELVLSKITKAKTKYIFTDWTPQIGPEVKKE